MSPRAVLLDADLHRPASDLRDFDGDGRTDFVVLGPEPHANQRTSNKLTTVLTTEDGYAEVMNEAPGIARDGFARDWDGDGDEDVILTDGYTVWIGRNDGSALFSFEELRTIESEISALLARDLDGDGVEELIARTYKEPRNINVHSLVEPFGDFLAAQITGEGVTTFGLGDLDADGTDELVAASDGLVEVFRAGDGFSYEPLGSIESSERVRALDVGDADGDGRAEVYTVEGQRIDLADGTLVASIGPTGIYGYSDAVRVEEGYGTVLLSSSRSLGGPGHLLEATIRDNSSRSGVAYYGERTKLLASGLIDGDDLPDLAFFAHELLGWWSSSSGEVRTMALEESFSDVKFRHVGRGLEAYLWTGVNDGVVSRVRLGDTFDVTALTPDGEWSAAKDSIFADLDRDGVDEWLSYNGVVQIDGTSLTFQPLADEDIVAASDLDDDGLVDLVTTQGIWTGSSGGFSKHSEWSGPDALVGAADVNGDGVGDLYGPGGVAFGGTLPPRLVAAPSGGWSDVVFPYDFDGDGNSEIVDVTFEELTGRISRLSSDAWAPAPQTVLTGQDVQTALVLDLDLDGHLDVVVGVDRGIRVLAGSCAE